MKVVNKILERMNELIALGESVLGTKRNPPSNSIGFDSSINSQELRFTKSSTMLAAKIIVIEGAKSALAPSSKAKTQKKVKADK